MSGSVCGSDLDRSTPTGRDYSAGEGMVRQPPEVPSIPVYELGYELRNRDVSLRAYRVEDRAHRVPQSESTDENRARMVHPSERDLGERFLGAVHPVGHEDPCTDTDDPTVTVTPENELGAVGHTGALYRNPFEH